MAIPDREGESGMKKKVHSSMSFNLIGVIILLLVILGVVVSLLGFLTFSDTIVSQYTESTRHMAETAAAAINGDHIDAYLAGEYPEEYQQTAARLDDNCVTMHVSLIYLIDVDRSDYGRFVSVFNSVNNEVDNSSYTPWELGYKRDTTNDEYRERYRSIYEKRETFQTVFRRSTRDGQHPHITSMVPVKNSAGEVRAILCMQRPISEIDEARRPYMIIVIVSTVLLCVIGALLVTAYLRRQFVRPIRKVSDEATRFAKQNTKGEDLAGISRYTELANLAGSIDKMETDMVKYMENLKTVTAEKERISAELSLARTIQANSIPTEFPPFPDRDEFDIYASMSPAREVGGDFYNFFLIDDDHLGVVIGDVSGKGVPAALFMMVTNILISDRTQMGSTPGEILRFVNNSLCERNKAEMFVTVWLAVLELSTGKLTASNAGHEYPVLRRAGGKYELYKDIHGFVVGGMDGVAYKEYELQLNPGDRVFVYTDGVPEATDAGNELFGTERMIEALNRDPEAEPEQLLNTVRGAVDGFVKEAEQFDDLTMLCLEYNGPGGKKAKE
jgi:sigma-B regulation protein RsbU (phosphoserine phosphatase)